MGVLYQGTRGRSLINDRFLNTYATLRGRPPFSAVFTRGCEFCAGTRHTPSRAQLASHPALRSEPSLEQCWLALEPQPRRKEALAHEADLILPTFPIALKRLVSGRRLIPERLQSSRTFGPSAAARARRTPLLIHHGHLTKWHPDPLDLTIGKVSMAPSGWLPCPSPYARLGFGHALSACERLARRVAGKRPHSARERAARGHALCEGRIKLLCKGRPMPRKIDSRAICQKILPTQSDSAFGPLLGVLRRRRNSH